ncbi:MAG: PAS domain S-box protein [Chloroflexi bacterium]|nr:PAS domain S-box protein [Chloroflexota bacterium]
MLTALKRWITPPVFDDEAKTHQAFLLHVILWALIFVPFPYAIYSVLRTPEFTTRALTQSIVGEVLTIFLMILLRRGYVRLASILHVIVFWIFLTASAATGSGVRGEAYLLGYSLSIVVAGILLGGRGALTITVLSLAAGVVMLYAEERGGLIPIFSSAPTTWIVSLVLFPVSAILQYLATHSVQTALKRARASEERYRLISEVSSDYTFSTEWGKDGRMKLNWVAGAFEKMTGYSYEEYAEKGGWHAFLHPSDVEQDARDLETLQRNQPVVTEIRFYRKDGTVRWARVHAHPVWDKAQNRLTGIVGAVEDITEHKQAEDRIRQYADIVANMQIGMYVFSIDDVNDDRTLRVTDANPAALRFSEKALDEVLGKPIDEAFITLRAKEFPQKYLEVLKTGTPINLEDTYYDGKDGALSEAYTVKAFPLPNKRVGVLFVDITERKKAELDREVLISELEAKNAELERFTYTVSHDLKSPLVTITGFLGFLEKDALAGRVEQVRENAQRISQAAEKMERLLNDLLELSRIGRLMNPPSSIPFQEIVREALELSQGRLSVNRVKVEVQKDLPIVRGDHVRLVEVMQNLIDNAAKFMGDQPQPVIQIGTRGMLDNMPIFFVRDNGIGIAPQFQERIFGIFNKLDPISEGTGIGLTLVKRIVEVHGGKIWIESEGARKGSTFCFTLPTS